ncbi:hypothetical protein L195_g009165 [Trifolium pratense]|uniref:Uncharacterized protein n=1 Tax=Trifolium pratense TaxID=57577 RepID=A0A2K3PBB0_TRIPR|nr:hypothetical protein L195_g009165 [Trifolium pratense]
MTTRTSSWMEGETVLGPHPGSSFKLDGTRPRGEVHVGNMRVDVYEQGHVLLGCPRRPSRRDLSQL